MYDREPFQPFMRTLSWRQGEHMLIAAPTQCGKSTLASMLATKRRTTVVLASKNRDDNLRKRYADYKLIRVWPPPEGEYKVILWPKWLPEAEATIAHQRAVFKTCLDNISKIGAWTVLVDEAHWTAQFLKLDRQMAILHHQGSSSGVTMMTLTQRPAWIPKIIYSSASHVFLGKTSDVEDLRTLSAMGGIDVKEVRDTLPRIGRHDLLYLNPMGNHPPVIINTRQ